MKKILSFIVLLAGVMTITSCNSDESVYGPENLVGKPAGAVLTIASSDLLFEAEGGNGSVTLNTTSAVTASTDANWLALAVNGNVVNIVANPNITLNGRSAVIKLAAGGAEATVTATQKSSIYGIPSLEYTIGDYRASLAIDVVHSQEVAVESQVSWLTAVFNSDTNQIEIVAEDNDGVDPREGIIKITMGDYTDEIAITQIGLLLEPEKTEVSTNDDNGTVTVAVSHSRAVTVESNDDWITARWDARKNVLECTLTANATGWKRSGTVTLTSGPATATVTITQADFEKDALGNYAYTYYYVDDNNQLAFDYTSATLTAEALIIHASSTLDLTIPVKFPNGKEEPWEMTVDFGQYVGIYANTYPLYIAFDNYQYNFLGRYANYYFNYMSASQANITIEEQEEEYQGQTYTWYGGEFGGEMYLLTNSYGAISHWNILEMTSEQFSQSAYVAPLMQLYDPGLEKIMPDDTNASRAAQSTSMKVKGHRLSKTGMKMNVIVR